MARYHRHSMQAALYLLFVSLLAAHHSSEASSFSLYEHSPSPQHKIGRLGFQSKWHAHWFQGKDGYLGGYWNASLTREFSSALPSQSVNPYTFQDLGVAAVFRYQRNDGTGFYAEAGTGPQYRSASYDLVGRSHGARLSLNTLAGVGFVWKSGVDLGFKAVHLTRGQGSDGNDAVSMVGIGLQYRW